MTATTVPSLRDTLLRALDETIGTARTRIGDCTDCREAADGLCPDHRGESEFADECWAARKILAGDLNFRSAL